MDKKNLRRADLVTSVILILGSIFMMFQSYKLFANPFSKAAEKLTEAEIAKNLELWYKSPGLIPLIISVVICALAIGLFIFAWKEGARFDFFKFEKLKFALADKEIKTAVIVVGTLAIYIYILMPVCRWALDFFYGFQGFPFAVATSIYISGMGIIYQRERNKKTIITSIIVGVVAAFAVALIFNKAAMIMLP